MKKVIFSAAALMIGAVALGQQVAPEFQSNPTLTVTQADALFPATLGNGNRAQADQLGNGQMVRVQQAGTLQSALVTQGNGSLLGGNVADIRQTGNVAMDPDSGKENAASVSQLGGANGALIDQEGNLNGGIVMQGADDDASNGNTAIQQQGVAENGEYNAAETYQDGTNNFSTVTQVYDRNSAWVDQTGTDNKSDITQNSKENLSDGQRAINVQNGTGNSSTIDQAPDATLVGDSGRSTALAFQNGTNNTSLQTQKSTAVEGNVGENAVISQGDTNIVIGASFSSPSTTVSALVDLDADLNIVGGSSVDAVAIQEQLGERNEAEIHQYGSGSSTPSNYAKQVQNQGSVFNQALIVQNNNGNSSGDGSYAFQDQSGSFHEATLAQNGFDHKAEQVQTGVQNLSVAVQRGRDNSLFTTQAGNFNASSVKQFGRDNIAFVDQDGTAQSAIVTQNGGEFGSFGNNQASIYQRGGTAGDLSGNPAQTTHAFDTRDAIAPIATSIVTVPGLTVTGGGI